MAGAAADRNTVPWRVGCELPAILSNGEDPLSLSLPPSSDLPYSSVASTA